MVMKFVPPIAIMAHDAAGFAYKCRAIGVVDIKEAGNAGLTLEGITSPYDLWNSSMPEDAYFVFPATITGKPNFNTGGLIKRLSSDPKYKKLDLFYNN